MTRKAIIVVPSDKVYDERIIMVKKDEASKDARLRKNDLYITHRSLDRKRNFTVPSDDNQFYNEILYADLGKEEASRLLKNYRESAKHEEMIMKQTKKEKVRNLNTLAQMKMERREAHARQMALIQMKKQAKRSAKEGNPNLEPIGAPIGTPMFQNVGMPYISPLNLLTLYQQQQQMQQILEHEKAKSLSYQQENFIKYQQMFATQEPKRG